MTANIIKYPNCILQIHQITLKYINLLSTNSLKDNKMPDLDNKLVLKSFEAKTRSIQPTDTVSCSIVIPKTIKVNIKILKGEKTNFQ